MDYVLYQIRNTLSPFWSSRLYNTVEEHSVRFVTHVNNCLWENLEEGSLVPPETISFEDFREQILENEKY